MLSICIPTYNTDCTELLDILAKQIAQLEQAVEVLVCDDCSTNYVNKNQKACERNEFLFFENGLNLGSVSTRIKLAKNSSFNWLLFIDADMVPVQKKFVHNYILNMKNDAVVFGGYNYKKNHQKNLLRKNYGFKREQKTVDFRKRNPYKYVFSGNMLIKKTIFIQSINNPRNCYGYDVLLGETFKKNKVKLLHIDNGTFHTGIEDNILYLKKIKEGAKLLRAQFENDEIVSNHNNLINMYKFLKKIYLTKILFSPYLRLHVIFEKTLLKFAGPILLLDWLRLYYFVNAK